jgi:hypothetical protein
VDRSTSSPRRRHRRSETAQAAGIATQHRAITDSGADGAFCFVFCEPRYLSGASADIDAAPFAIVRAVPDDGEVTWVPKLSFATLAEIHRNDKPQTHGCRMEPAGPARDLRTVRRRE